MTEDVCSGMLVWVIHVGRAATFMLAHFYICARCAGLKQHSRCVLAHALSHLASSMCLTLYLHVASMFASISAGESVDCCGVCCLLLRRDDLFP